MRACLRSRILSCRDIHFVGALEQYAVGQFCCFHVIKHCPHPHTLHLQIVLLRAFSGRVGRQACGKGWLRGEEQGPMKCYQAYWLAAWL